MKLITFITILGFSLFGCTNEERKTPELSPEQQEEFEFEREELEIQREQDQRGRTSKAYRQDVEVKEEELD